MDKLFDKSERGKETSAWRIKGRANKARSMIVVVALLCLRLLHAF